MCTKCNLMNTALQPPDKSYGFVDASVLAGSCLASSETDAAADLHDNPAILQVRGGGVSE